MELWSEGYQATGQSSGAIFHGNFDCKTLKEAVILFKESLKDTHSKECIDIDSLTFWGCSFFDNEFDARKSFG